MEEVRVVFSMLGARNKKGRKSKVIQNKCPGEDEMDYQYKCEINAVKVSLFIRKTNNKPTVIWTNREQTRGKKVRFMEVPQGQV